MAQKITELQKVLTQSEVDEANHFFKKAFNFAKEKKYAEAVACFDVSLRLDPLNKTAKKYRVSAKEKQGEVFCLT
jgi:hypothetical protein